MNNIFPNQEDDTTSDLFSLKFRKRRFKLFLNLLDSLAKSHIEILDVGGTVIFWENMDFINLCERRKINITILNLTPQVSKYGFIETVIGDARDLTRFKDRQFDIAFSNSAIEHVGKYEDQKCMAQEIRRVGKRYFIQTPNYYFPIEPHFIFPFFQFFPFPLKVFLLRHFDIGCYKKTICRQEAVKRLEEIRLMRLGELKKLFPDAGIYKERVLGFTKSFVFYKFQ